MKFNYYYSNYLQSNQLTLPKSFQARPLKFYLVPRVQSFVNKFRVNYNIKIENQLNSIIIRI